MTQQLKLTLAAARSVGAAAIEQRKPSTHACRRGPLRCDQYKPQLWARGVVLELAYYDGHRQLLRPGFGDYLGQDVADTPAMRNSSERFLPRSPSPRTHLDGVYSLEATGRRLLALTDQVW